MGFNDEDLLRSAATNGEVLRLGGNPNLLSRDPAPSELSPKLDRRLCRSSSRRELAREGACIWE